MAINGDYSTPVSVNGYPCWNCTDVANAKKHIDPEHPKAGPYGIDAANDPSLRNNAKPAVEFGGALSGTSIGTGSPERPDIGTVLDISA